MLSWVRLGIGAVAIAWIWPILTVAAQPHGTKICLMECTSKNLLTRKIPQELLKSYENSICGGKISVILTTRKNRSFCASPSADWVQEAMRKMDATNPMPKTTPVFQKREGGAITTSARAEGRARPTGTAASVGNASSAGPMAANPSTQPTSERVDPGATLQPETTANGDADRHVTSRPGGSGEDLDTSPPQVTSHVAHAISTVHGRFGSERPMGLPDKDPREEEVTPSMALSWHPIVSTTEHAVVPSDSGVDPRSQTTPDLRTVAQRKAFTGQLGTRPDADGKRSTAVRAKDRNDTWQDPTVVVRVHLVHSLPTDVNKDIFPQSATIPPTSGFHQENTRGRIREEETEKTPFISSSILAKYQMHLISLMGGTVILFLFAGIAWVYFKTHICARSSRRQMVRSLVYSPVDSYADDYSMQNL